ncbi:polymer-forming cytoskeletal protein [Verrucomicrobiota bacterium]
MEDRETAKTIIGKDAEIVGSIKRSSNIQIDGKLNGDLSCSGNAIIGKTANVKGNLSVNSVTVYGQINGNTIAKDRIDLKSSARVNGDIKAACLTVEDGVSFVGKSEVNPSGIPLKTSSASKSSVHEISPPEPEETGTIENEEAQSRKNEIRKDVKKEAKEKASGLFGRK